MNVHEIAVTTHSHYNTAVGKANKKQGKTLLPFKAKEEETEYKQRESGLGISCW